MKKYIIVVSLLYSSALFCSAAPAAQPQATESLSFPYMASPYPQPNRSSAQASDNPKEYSLTFKTNRADSGSITHFSYEITLASKENQLSFIDQFELPLPVKKCTGVYDAQYTGSTFPTNIEDEELKATFIRLRNKALKHFVGVKDNFFEQATNPPKPFVQPHTIRRGTIDTFNGKEFPFDRLDLPDEESLNK